MQGVWCHKKEDHTQMERVCFMCFKEWCRVDPASNAGSRMRSDANTFFCKEE